MADGGAIAQAAVEIVADTSRFRDDLRRKLREAGAAAGDSFGAALEDHAGNAGADVGERLRRESTRSGERAGISWGDAFRNAIALRVSWSALSAIFAPLRGLTKSLGFATLAAGAASAAGSLVTVAAALAPATGALLALPAAAGVGAAVMGTLAVATLGVGEAFEAALSGDAEKFAEALEKLSPAAQSVATEFRDLVPALEQTRSAVQDAFFSQLEGQLTGIASSLSGPVRAGMTSVAEAAGRVAARVGDIAQEAATADVVSRLFDAATASVNNLSPGIAAIVSGIRDLAGVAAPVIAALSAEVGSLAEQFGEWLQEVSASGQALEWIEDGLATLRQFGDLLLQVGGIIAAVFSAAETAGGGTLEVLVELTRQANAFLSTAQGQAVLVDIFTALYAIGAALMPVLEALLGALGQIAPFAQQIAVALGPGLAAGVSALGAALAALAPGLAAVAEALSTALVDPQFQAALVAIGRAAGDLLTALAPLLPTIAQLAAALGEALANAVTAALPFISGLVDILVALSPILTVVADAVAALAGPLVEVAATVLGVVSALKLLTTVINAVRLAWTLLSIAFAVSPIGALITLIAGLVSAFVYLWNTSADFRDFFIGIWEAIKSAVSAAVEWIGDALSSIGSFFADLPGQVGGFLSSLVDTIGSALGTAAEAVLEFFGNLPSQIGSLLSSLASTVGSALVSAGSAVLDFFAALPGQILDFLAQLPAMLWTLFVDALTLAAEAVGYGIGAIAALIVGIPMLIWEALVGLGEMLFNLFTTAWNWAVNAVVAGVNAVVNFVRALPGRVVTAVSALGSMLAGWATAAWNWARNAFVSGVNAVVNFVTSLPGKVINAISSLGSRLWTWAKNAFVRAKDGVVSGAAAVVDFVKSIPDKIVSALGDLGSLLWDAGASIIQGFLDGLKSAWDSVTSFISGIGDWISENKGPLPYDRRLLVPHGRAIVRGLDDGLRAEFGRVQSTVRGFTTSLPKVTVPVRAATPALPTGALLTPTASPAGRVGGRTTQRTVHVNAPITVHTVARDPRLVAAATANRIAELAQA